jgi:hypothetical protein
LPCGRESIHIINISISNPQKYNKGLTLAGLGLTARNPSRPNNQLTNTALTGTPLLDVLSNLALIFAPHPVFGHTFLMLASACKSLDAINNPLTPQLNAENI